MKRVTTPLVLLSLAAILIAGHFIKSLADKKDGPSREDREAPRVAKPVAFKDGNIKGWKVALPTKRALATPAVVDGKVFVGGGFGSHEFYAFDAETGKMLWQYRT